MNKLIQSAALVVMFCPMAMAIHRGADDLPYSQSMSHPLDAPLNEHYDGKCFFMNLGPTGIRARIDPEAPKQFKVTYVFQDGKSPAKGKINVGDVIVGANGKKFSNPHGFHRKQGGRGWPGPPYELALAIEDSQGKDGILELMVWVGGSDTRKSNVTIQLEPVGRFSDTWPWDCPRSEKLLKDLCDFMFENGVSGRHHQECQQLLALWASGDKRAKKLVKAKAERLMDDLPDPNDGGMCTWGWGYTGIFLGEYYHATGDKGCRRVIERLNECYETGQDWRNGGFSHRPFPAIQRRIASGGPKGYGAMAAPGGLSMLAQSIFIASGLPHSEKAYKRTHEAFLRTAGGDNRSGGIAYGFRPWSDLHIRVKNPATMSPSENGIGYECPTGMKTITDYEVEKWTQKNDGSGQWDMRLVDPKEFPWLFKEAEKLGIYDQGEDRRLVVRPEWSPEPTRPYDNDHRGGGHNAPVGMGALAHFIGNKGNTAWNYLAQHMATCCAYSPQTLWDGHACAEMHAFFATLGASRAEASDFRHFLDYTKTWIVLSETHDGGLVEQPFGCQRNSTCSIPRDRRQYTHVAILLLSIPKRNLLITGADYAQPAPPPAATGGGGLSRPVPPVAPVPQLRKPRQLTREKIDILDRALRRALSILSDNHLLKPVAMELSFSSSRVVLTKADPEGQLTLQLADGSKTATVDWSRLSARDRVLLAVLVSNLKPDSKDAMAMVGVYMEAIGNVRKADDYFEKAGEAATEKLSQLFD